MYFDTDMERRRVYDIVNILEALRIISRSSKNFIQWIGMHSLSKTFESLSVRTLESLISLFV